MKKDNLKPKILITGSSGFIGKHLVKRLSDFQIIEYQHSKKNASYNKRKNESIDIVIHLSAKTPYGNKKSKSFLKENFISVLDILDFCVENKVKKIIYCSSYVYGIPKSSKITEQHVINPHNEYSQSKFWGEQLCEYYHKIYGLDVVILRPFNIYGKDQKEGYLISNIVNSLKNHKKIKVINSESKRDFLYVEDFVELILKLIKIQFKFEIFNVGFGKSYSFKEIIKKCEKISNKKINVSYKKDTSSYIPNIICDNSKIMKKTSWKPTVNIDEGLQKIIDHFML
jgi:UDP-glucose 4-epimerase